jgi:hypothetical protein
VGQIALAVVLAQAVWRLVNAVTWYLLIPLIGRSLQGNTESVFFKGSALRPLPWENLLGMLLEFRLLVILVFYLNRRVQRNPIPPGAEDGDVDYSSDGEGSNVQGAEGNDTRSSSGESAHPRAVEGEFPLTGLGTVFSNFPFNA